MSYIRFQRGIKWVQQNTKKSFEDGNCLFNLEVSFNGLSNIHLTHNVIFSLWKSTIHHALMISLWSRKNVTTIATLDSNLTHNTQNHKPHQGYTHKISFWVLHAHLFLPLLLMNLHYTQLTTIYYPNQEFVAIIIW